MKPLQSIIWKEFEKNKSVKAKDLVSLLNAFILENDIDIANVSNFVNRTISLWLKSGSISKIGKGEYILDKTASNVEKRVKQYMYDNEEVIIELRKIIKDEDWFYSKISLEQYLGINIQRGSALHINMKMKPTKIRAEKLKELGIQFRYTKSEVDSIVSFSIAELFHLRKYDEEDIAIIKIFLKEKNILVSDLLKANFDEMNFTFKKVKGWISDFRDGKRHENLSYNIKLLLGE